MNMEQTDIKELKKMIRERDELIKQFKEIKKEANRQVTLAETNEMLYEAHKVSCRATEATEAIREFLCRIGVPQVDVECYIETEYGLFPNMDYID